MKKMIRRHLQIDRCLVFTIFLLSLLIHQSLFAQSVTLINYFDAYHGGILPSTDPAGIAYDGDHLIIVDSEINESGVPPVGYFNGYNTFKLNLDGTIIYNQYLTSPANSSIEPTGICFNPTDGYYYITNDNTMQLYQYELNDSLSLINSWNLKDTPFIEAGLILEDPEGVCADPISGHLFICDGEEETGGGRRITRVEIIDGEISILSNFNVVDRVLDPEGIAFHESSGHLFIVSDPDKKIFEYDIDGTYITAYDIKDIVPPLISPQGLTFAPNSINGERLSLYIADGGLDGKPDGARIYEIDLGDSISLPAQLFSFHAQHTREGIRLSWRALMEYEGLTWLIERSDEESEEFRELMRIEGKKQLGEEPTYEVYDQEVIPGNTYHYRLSDIDTFGKITPHQSIRIELKLPKTYHLSQNFPNPFNPSTTIIFALPQSGDVSIDIFNTLGQKVDKLLDQYMYQGEHEVSFQGEHLPSGFYIYQIKAGNYTDAKKMLLLR